MTEADQVSRGKGPLGFVKWHYSDTKLRRTDAQVQREKTFMGSPFNRWLMFPAAFIFQAVCGSLYAWSVFNNHIDVAISGKGANGKPIRVDAPITFYVAVGFFGFSAALNGPWLERVGPRFAALTGTTLFFIGNMIAALGIHFKIMGVIYFGYGVIGGTGLGLCYISPVSALQKWFPDRRGMAAGFAVCGFGAGSIALAKVPDPLILSIGLTNTFITLGCCYFGIMFMCCLVFRVPPPGFTINGLDIYRNKVDENGDVETNANDKNILKVIDPATKITLIESIFSREYRMIYLMFFGNSIAGLVFLSRLSNIVQDIFTKSPETASTIVSINGGFNLAGRLLFSTASDRLGRKNAYLVMLTTQVICLASLPTLMENRNYPAFLAFIWILTSCYGGGFGCIPAFLCDMFGPTNIGALHGIILTAWSIAGVGGGLLFTAIFNNMLADGWTTKDAHIYGFNLYWMLGICAVGFIFIIFVRTSIRDRLLPTVPGEFTRFRLFGRLIRFGNFGVQAVSKDTEDSEWDAYVDSHSATNLEDVTPAHTTEKYGKAEVDA